MRAYSSQDSHIMISSSRMPVLHHACRYLVVGEAVMLQFSMMQQGVPATSRGGCGTATSVRRLILQAIVMVGCGLGVIVVGQRLCLVSTCGPEHHRYL
jgi:hypothetical protein